MPRLIGIPGAVAFVVAALINLIALNWDHIFPLHDEEVAPPSSVGVADSPKDSAGEWQRRDIDTVYRAETDGYVTAYSSGDGTIEGAILDGPTRDPKELRWRTRFLALSGATLPVEKGRYWMVKPVRPERGNKDTIKVQWWGGS